MHIKLISSSSNFESHPCQLKNTENKYQHAVTKLWLKLQFHGCHIEVVEQKCSVVMLPFCVLFQNNHDRDVHAAVDFYKYQ